MTITLSATSAEIGAQHHTTKYQNGLVVRRGFPVKLQTSSTSLTIRLVSVRNNADLSYSFQVSQKSPTNGWSLTSSGSQVTLVTPHDAVVGLYTVADADDSISMAVIFNAFSENDAVYMATRDQRDEYVLNDNGRIWVGSSYSPGVRPWSFGQYRQHVWQCALSLLDSLPVEQRRDPIKVTRHLSAAVNSQDDNGIISGRWDGNYDDGISPTAWTGSAAILEQYWKTHRSVRYGQCWVFSGVLTTVNRALGIPCRSVTNFVSAHDTQRPYNRAVDYYFDSDGEPLERMSADSIWNFHVWNSAWMLRPDLRDEGDKFNLKFDGWQAIDATPQEESSGLYQLGPASVAAVKHGYNLNYDVDFVIGEVNADVVHYWRKRGSQEFEVRAKYVRHVGQKISTKAVGSDRRHDITLEYKFPEGSREERMALANRASANLVPEAQPEDVRFSIVGEPVVKAGDKMQVLIRAHNNGEAVLNVRLKCVYRATDYTGTARAKIGSRREDVQVRAGETEELLVEVGAKRYQHLLGGGTQTVQFMCSGRVKESGQVWSEDTLVRVDADDALQLRAPQRVRVGERANATAIIRNDLTVSLTKIKLRVEGEGLLDGREVDVDAVRAGRTAEVQIALRPTEVGDRVLIATLDTAELKDVSRSVHVEVVR